MSVLVGGEVAPQVNKFKQVSSDDYQMSVTEEGFAGAQVPSWGRGRAGGPLDSMSREEGVPYHVTYLMVHKI